jgi:hypothetical protein
MNPEPRIEPFTVKLVGIQGIVKTDQDIRDEVAALWERVFKRLDEIKNRSESKRRIGYWLSIDGVNKVLFAGVEVNSFDGMREDLEDGFVFWDIGKMTCAVWKEKNEQVGSISHVGQGYSWLKDSPYKFDSRFIGDFEVNNDRFNEEDIHEKWIPIEEK